MDNRRELHESVQELDDLLDNLKEAQISDERSYVKRLNQQSHLYSSSSSLNFPSNSNQTTSSRPSSRASQQALQKLASETPRSRSRTDLEKSAEHIPKGVFVKDVVEEEVLVDHVKYQPKTQKSDKNVITKSLDENNQTEQDEESEIDEKYNHLLISPTCFACGDEITDVSILIFVS